MAAIPITAMEVFRTVDGAPEFTMTFLEAASQTFKAGAPVKHVAGYVTALTSAAPGVQAILGLALEPGHNDTTAGTHSVKVAIADDRTIFIGNLDAGAAALIDIGKSYSIEYDSTYGHWVINKSGGPAATANRHVIVIGLSPYQGTDIADTTPRLLFMFHPVSRQLMYTS